MGRGYSQDSCIVKLVNSYLAGCGTALHDLISESIERGKFIILVRPRIAEPSNGAKEKSVENGPIQPDACFVGLAGIDDLDERRCFDGRTGRDLSIRDSVSGGRVDAEIKVGVDWSAVQTVRARILCLALAHGGRRERACGVPLGGVGQRLTRVELAGTRVARGAAVALGNPGLGEAGLAEADAPELSGDTPPSQVEEAALRAPDEHKIRD